MRIDSLVSIRREDYRPPSFFIDHIALAFDLHPTQTEVEAQLRFRHNAEVHDNTFRLNGEQIDLVSIALDGVELPAAQYVIENNVMMLRNAPASGVLTVRTRCNPRDNATLEGLYLTQGTFCTQCEAEGFRRITYFPDRPDIMARYKVTIRADQTAYPVLLANGNLVKRRTLDNGRHEVVWEDPFPKPSYLFALVAGALVTHSDHFMTQSGRKVTLEIYTKPHNLDQCDFAMQALKRAMRWDETEFGREYDLDRFMIYCADDFNFGAMENKGLNIFNSPYILAKASTATDENFATIESIVGHEYFHNWSGNRVTCRDWFQLSLKEGFTVFRDQRFSEDMGSAGVCRAMAVADLRQYQFVEDASPLSHSVRPDAYVSIDNFYTSTIYEKGAEVVRMLFTLLGAKTFRDGSDEYFNANDGRAATCDDFIAAMERVSGRDLTQFKRWYETPGTPTVSVSSQFDTVAQKLILTLSQKSTRPDAPLVIPFAVGLLSPEGKETHPTRVLELTTATQCFTFDHVTVAPHVSLLRGFSAPVILEVDRSEDSLATLAIHDSDGVSRWDAFEALKSHALISMLTGAIPPPTYDAVVRALLNDQHTDAALLAMMLRVPAAHEAMFPQGTSPLAFVGASHALRRHTASAHRGALLDVLQRTRANKAYQFTPDEVARRALHNVALELLNAGGDEQAATLAYDQFSSADNMTDTLAALGALSCSSVAKWNEIVQTFYARHENEPLVFNKWLAIQAESPSFGTVSLAQALMQHAKFDRRNPNNVRAVVFGLALRNWTYFHATDGSGYQFLAQQIVEVDRRNPKLSAILTTPFKRWREFDGNTQSRQRKTLESLRREPRLSENVIELLDKLLTE